ncbi:[citrate (pro-3S)-lyase] ligase [Rodentibacter pneumotropicus]|uniref:[citrate (Pro-3S)-lyase] ligase n=1 Tax=Rodentibacter pneumotropicus TaxID=758 RepID=A0A3S4XYV4_9PAST|nr:[citrate (pro-3S)-lyase] ligase [Rodentibacter pneumotropicus]
MFDEDFNIIATGACFGNTLRCLAVSSDHQGEGLMNQIITHLVNVQIDRGHSHLFLYTKCESAKFSMISAFGKSCKFRIRSSLWKTNAMDLKII